MQNAHFSSLNRRQDQTPLAGQCSKGGKWYACKNIPNGFVGCCTIDPCTSAGCTIGNVRASSLGEIRHGTAPDQVCRSGGDFYTCVSADFWGCCKSNPCGSGCPQESLRPASLDNDTNNPFVSSSKSMATSTSGPSRTVFIAAAVGGFVATLLCIILGWYLRRRRKQSRVSEHHEPEIPKTHAHSYDGQPQLYSQSPAPAYQFVSPAVSHSTEQPFYPISSPPTSNLSSPQTSYPQKSPPSLPPHARESILQARPNEGASWSTTVSNASPKLIPGWNQEQNANAYELVGSPRLDVSDSVQPARAVEIAELPAELPGDSNRLHSRSSSYNDRPKRHMESMDSRMNTGLSIGNSSSQEYFEEAGEIRPLSINKPKKPSS